MMLMIAIMIDMVDDWLQVVSNKALSTARNFVANHKIFHCISQQFVAVNNESRNLFKTHFTMKNYCILCGKMYFIRM